MYLETMEFEALEIKIADLPKEISISVPAAATDDQIKEIVEDLRSQILYNSRLEDDAAQPNLNVTVLERQASLLKLRATV